MVRWSADLDRLLLLAFIDGLKISLNPANIEKVANAFAGDPVTNERPTAKAISERIYRMKTMMKLYGSAESRREKKQDGQVRTQKSATTVAADTTPLDTPCASSAQSQPAQATSDLLTSAFGTPPVSTITAVKPAEASIITSLKTTANKRKRGVDAIDGDDAEKAKASKLAKTSTFTTIKAQDNKRKRGPSAIDGDDAEKDGDYQPKKAKTTHKTDKKTPTARRNVNKDATPAGKRTQKQVTYQDAFAYPKYFDINEYRTANGIQTTYNETYVGAKSHPAAAFNQPCHVTDGNNVARTLGMEPSRLGQAGKGMPDDGRSSHVGHTAKVQSSGKQGRVSKKQPSKESMKKPTSRGPKSTPVANPVGSDSQQQPDHRRDSVIGHSAAVPYVVQDSPHSEEYAAPETINNEVSSFMPAESQGDDLPSSGSFHQQSESQFQYLLDEVAAFNTGESSLQHDQSVMLNQQVPQVNTGGHRQPIGLGIYNYTTIAAGVNGSVNSTQQNVPALNSEATGRSFANYLAGVQYGASTSDPTFDTATDGAGFGSQMHSVDGVMYYDPATVPNAGMNGSDNTSYPGGPAVIAPATSGHQMFSTNVGMLSGSISHFPAPSYDEMTGSDQPSFQGTPAHQSLPAASSLGAQCDAYASRGQPAPEANPGQELLDDDDLKLRNDVSEFLDNMGPDWDLIDFQD